MLIAFNQKNTEARYAIAECLRDAADEIERMDRRTSDAPAVVPDARINDR
jgi:hypothetical protein